MKKYNRREIIHLTAVSSGMLTLTGCLPSKEKKEETPNKPGNGTGNRSEEEDLNRAMSRESVLVMMEQRAASLMNRSSHCAQSSFLTIKEQFNLEDGAILKALTPLPGLAERGLTCGAVTGCLMAMGLLFGRDRIDDWKGYRDSLGPAGAFIDQYKQKIGSINCSDILEERLGKAYDLSDSGEQADYVRAGGPEKCTELIREIVRMAGSIILEHKYGK